MESLSVIIVINSQDLADIVTASPGLFSAQQQTLQISFVVHVLAKSFLHMTSCGEDDPAEVVMA